MRDSDFSSMDDYASGVSGREGFGYSGDTSNTSYVGDDPSGGEIGLASIFSPTAFSNMDARGSGGRTGGRADFGVGYGRASIPTAQNILANSGQPTFGDRGSALNMNEFMALKGISAADPFAGSKQFGFTDYMGGLDYRGQRNTLDDIQRQYAQYFNPFGKSGLDSVLSSKYSPTGLDQNSLDALQKDLNRLNRNPNIQGNEEKGDLREGLQREYGSIFGSSAGTPTLQGNVVDQDRQFGAGEMMARGLASLAPGPFGTILSQIGKTKPTLDTSSTYDPTKDPNSPEYKGPGYFGNLTNVLTGGAGTQISDKVSKEITSLFDGIDFLNKPTNDKDITTYPETQNYGSRIKSGIGAIDPNVTQNAIDNIVSDNMASDRSPGKMNAVFGPQIATLLGGLTPNEAMRYAGISNPAEDGNIPPSEYRDPFLSMNQQIAQDVGNITAFNNYNSPNQKDTIPNNMSFSELMNSTTPGTREYMETLGFNRPF